MTGSNPASPFQELIGQTVVVLGGSSGIGLEAARRARAAGAGIVLAARNAERLSAAAAHVGAQYAAALDVADHVALGQFFADLPGPVDHVLLTAGKPEYGPVMERSREDLQSAISKHSLVITDVARSARGKIRAGGTLTALGGTGARRISSGAGVLSVIGGALSALTAVLAVELAPVRVNLIAAGFVDTPLSAALLKDQLGTRRADLRERLPIHRVVTAADVASLAVHIMANTAITGAVYDIDGGEQLIP
ncbi:SDR family oxidoreductase [Streptomyces sp. NPDC055025]